MTDASPSPRLPGIDVARGVAVAAMIVYHFAWDLRFFGLIATDIVSHPLWMAFARAIAGSFLLLSGVGLSLMARGGIDGRAVLRRLALIGGAALLVTIATWIAFPQAFIFFGILHCIAVSSVVALPFLRAPTAAVVVAAAAILALPFAFSHPVFDAPALQWLGLGVRAPNTNDFVPVFPWTGFVLAGVALGRPLAKRPPAVLLRPATGAAGVVAKAGRRSLAIYLLHQPVLLAFVWLAALGLAPAGVADETAEFRRSCRQTCEAAGGGRPTCERYCGCAEADIKAAGLWTPLLRDALAAGQRQQLAAIVDMCEARTR